MSKRPVQIVLLVLVVLAGVWIWWTLSMGSNDPDEINWNMDVRQGYHQAAETLQAKAPWEYEALKAAEAALEAAQATKPEFKPFGSQFRSSKTRSQTAWEAYDAALEALEKAKTAATLKAPQAYESYEAYHAALMALEKASLVFGAARKFDSIVKTATKTGEVMKAAKAVYNAANAAYELLANLEGPLAESLVNMDELMASYGALKAAYRALYAADEAYGVVWQEADEAARKSYMNMDAFKTYAAAQASYQAAIRAYLKSLPEKAAQEDILDIWRRMLQQ